MVLRVIGLVFSTRQRGDPNATRHPEAMHPVWSSVTTDGDEAAHVNPRLPERGRHLALMLAALVTVGLIAWWRARA